MRKTIKANAEFPVGSIATDKTILRQAIQAELDAINQYEQFAANVKNKKIREVLLDIAREEKVHVGELTELLNTFDDEHEEAVKEGEKEARKEIS